MEARPYPLLPMAFAQILHFFSDWYILRLRLTARSRSSLLTLINKFPAICNASFDSMTLGAKRREFPRGGLSESARILDAFAKYLLLFIYKNLRES